MSPSPLYLPTVAPHTFEQAVNAMIVAGGEGPIANSVVHRPDREAAAQILEESLREVQGEGWTFNTEHGLEISSAATIEWAGTDGTTATLNIFEPPPNLLSFKVTQGDDQHDLDFIARPPRDWLGGPLVFYDRVLNRDGYADRTSLFIDPVWLMDYEDIPQDARNVVFLRAVRRFLQQIVGDLAAADRKAQDEGIAYRQLRLNFRSLDRYNMFGNRTTARHFGYRWFDQSTVNDTRGTRSGSVGGPGYRTVVAVDVSPSTIRLASFEDEGGFLRPAASISLRRTELALTVTNPLDGAVDKISMVPDNFVLELETALPLATSIQLAADNINLTAPPATNTVVTAVSMVPDTFEIETVQTAPVPSSITLLSSTVSLSAAAASFTMAAALSSGDVLNPGQSRSGTITVTRSGGFTGAVTVASTDSRISFPSGTTVAVGQTTLGFVYTLPGGAATGSVSTQITGAGSGVAPAAANLTVLIGSPSMDASVGVFSNLLPAFATSVTGQVVRTNFSGPVTVTANWGLNPTPTDRQNNIDGGLLWLDITGTNVSQTSGTIVGGGGSSTLPAGTSTFNLSVAVASNATPGSRNITLTFSSSGVPTIQRQFSINIVSSGGGGTDPNAVSTISMVPGTFTLQSTSANPAPASVVLGSSSVSLTLS